MIFHTRGIFVPLSLSHSSSSLKSWRHSNELRVCSFYVNCLPSGDTHAQIPQTSTTHYNKTKALIDIPTKHMTVHASRVMHSFKDIDFENPMITIFSKRNVYGSICIKNIENMELRQKKPRQSTC